ncbi:MAG: 7-cyano-7-deazaguanine synthase QueC [Nitrospirae bacterium]|nr:7-cyano-7-deazaguanine synthase QueC [Nitrospirota bacterium]
MSRKAVVLASGGVDSTTVMAMVRAEGFDLYALTVDYGQRHRQEIERARSLASHMGAKEHLVITVNLREIGGSALTASVPVPKDRSAAEMEKGIPPTYVPARNTLFLSLALGWAEVLDAADIFIGANVIDYSGYPDCRPEYLRAFERMANLATRAGVEGRCRFAIHAPLLQMTKGEIIRRGIALGVDYGMTLSCYDPAPDGKPCGRCDSCLLREKGFAEAGIKDLSQ